MQLKVYRNRGLRHHDCHNRVSVTSVTVTMHSSFQVQVAQHYSTNSTYHLLILLRFNSDHLVLWGRSVNLRFWRRWKIQTTRTAPMPRYSPIFNTSYQVFYFTDVNGHATSHFLAWAAASWAILVWFSAWMQTWEMALEICFQCIWQ